MKIYLMGICGTAMSHVALLLKQAGHQICGSDQTFFDPMASLLKKYQIETFQGYNVDRLKQWKPDAIIVGNVISRGNPEIEYLLNNPFCPFYSFPEFLEKKLLKNRQTFVVTGTHGKTTTTAALAYYLQQHCPVGYLIGGLPNNFESGSTYGKESAPFVIEGDEYDTAFFDKRSKFFHYWPNTLIINNLEFDHGDIFPDLTSIQRAFSQLTRLVPSQGFIIYNGDDTNVRALLPCPWAQVQSVGLESHNDWQIKNVQDSINGLNFEVWYHNTLQGQYHSPLHGIFNARNLTMALVACTLNGYNIDPQTIAHFRGVQRRQVIRYQDETLTIIEDFGHHPTAVAAVLNTLKNCYPTHKIIACFEPACNTSASQHFGENIAQTFHNANEVWFAPTNSKLPIHPTPSHLPVGNHKSVLCVSESVSVL